MGARATSFRRGMSMLGGGVKALASVFALPGSGMGSFDAAGHGRRMKGFAPPRSHVNAAIQKAGPTIVARARWLYENDAYAGQIVDEWVSAAIGEGIKPRPRIKDAKLKKQLLDLWWRWTEEADAEGNTDFYGLQANIAREVFLAGECFVRRRSRRPGDMQTVPLQIQILPTEMLDPSYNEQLPGNGYIRAGIEFNGIGRRVAYHFWRNHPYDERMSGMSNLRERVRVPADEVLHVYDAKQAGQIRGVPRVARVMVKLFTLEAYDDAELDRKKTAALFTAFLIGRGENPIVNDEDEEDEDGAPLPNMSPGAFIDLGDDKDIKFSSPTEVGGSYDAFQYRNLAKISAGTGLPYSYVSGDVAKGNFSNVRTDIIRFRRRVGQWQAHVMRFQACRPVWAWFCDHATLAGLVELPGYDEDPTPYWACEWLPPRQEWIDPAKDAAAEKLMVDARFKSRSQVIASLGYDREAVDQEIAEDAKSARDLGIEPVMTPAAGGPAPAEPDEDDRAREREDEGETDDAA